MARLTLPPGSYAVSGKGTAFNFEHTGSVGCTLWVGATRIDASAASVEDGEDQFSVYHLSGGVNLPGGGEVVMTCATFTDGMEASNNVLSAIKVTTLH